MQQSRLTPTPPRVSIILPVFNDQDHIAGALDSCLAQTLPDVEIIVVDDASTDDTVEIVSRYVTADSRVHLIRQEKNSTAFQARRVGIEAARAPFILFLDGDDELVPDAARVAVTAADEQGADVVGFGCQVIKPDGSTGGGFESAMQPKHGELNGMDIVGTLFPMGKTAQGQLWRYLFDRALLVAAYASLPGDLQIPRANDLPITFLSLMRAQKYVSTSAVLYRYFFRRGMSGHRIASFADYNFVASAIDSVETIAAPMIEQAAIGPDGDELEAIYNSVRLSIVGRVIEAVREIIDEELRTDCMRMLRRRVGIATLVAACADFCPKALPLLGPLTSAPNLSARDPRHIVLRASNLGTGGAQGVVVAQSAYLAAAGFEVTIVVESEPDTHFRLADGVSVSQITGRSLGHKVANFTAFCIAQSVDVVIDHYVLYHERWPYYVVALANVGVPTIGWIHNFALRPVLDGSTRTSFLERYLPLLALTVVLSEADVAYWKLLGVDRVAYLPNPASPLLEGLTSRSYARPAPNERLEIVWWGRLQQSTKQVRELIEIGALLRELGVEFRITIIGPDGRDLTAAQLVDLARARGIVESVFTVGQLHHDELVAATEQAHVFVSTSVIEGYPLAFVEAQSLGLPLVMYDLPWLATLPGNDGVVSVPQGDRRGAAQALAALVADPSLYAELSEGSLRAANRALSHNFAQLYADLVRGQLSSTYSPSVSILDARLLVEQNLRFSERLIGKERRAADRLRASVAKKEKSLRRLENALNRRTAAEARVPSVVRTGVRGWLMNFLPTSMRQSSYYARHNFNTSLAQHHEVLISQTALDARLARIEASLEALQKAVNLGSTVQPATHRRAYGADEASASLIEQRISGSVNIR